MTIYNEQVRQQIADTVKGKTVEMQEYDKEGDYYTITFTDGSEFSFRFMADL